IYDKDIVSAQAGRYVGYWLATGANAGAHTQIFVVRTATETAIVSLDEAKEHINHPATSTTPDQELERMIGSATEVVEYFCGPIVRRSYTDEVVGGCAELILHHDQVVSLTSVTPILTSAPSVILADLDVSPTGIVRHKSGLPISSGPLRVVYVAARTDIPDNLILAALIIVKHLWDTQRGPGAPSVLGRQGGGEELTFLPVMGFAIPNRAMDLMKLHPAPAGIA
ncbi:MAG: hypothetical protein ACRD0W_01070, partial [Acidimicrobiales bacterium]